MSHAQDDAREVGSLDFRLGERRSLREGGLVAEADADPRRDAAAPAGSLVGGSVAGTYTDLNANSVSISSVDGGSIYTAFVDATEVDPFDGTVVGNLLDNASGTAGLFQSGTFGESAFGDFPILPGQSFGGADTNYGFAIEFTLSAGDTAGFTASMAIATPAPGAVALLGVSGLFGRRRRRSAD